MSWACDMCGHAPHGVTKKNPTGKCQLRAGGKITETGVEQGVSLCSCSHVTDRDARAAEIMSAHEAADRRDRA